jgi:hypothetical protein
MTPTSMVRQVRVQKNGRERVVWIPSSLAQRGHYIQFRDGGGWDDGWKVTDVYSLMPTAFMAERSRDYRTQRSVSDA